MTFDIHLIPEFAIMVGMKKYILYFVFSAIVILLVWSVQRDMKIKEIQSDNQLVESEESGQTAETETGSMPQTQTTTENTVAGKYIKIDPVLPVSERAWASFQNYLESYKTHDVKAIGNFSYNHKFGPECQSVLNNENDEKKRAVCFSNIDRVYKSIPNFKKTDFPHALSDSKQVILFSDSEIKEDGIQKTSFKKMLYFVIESGNIKPLAIDPGRGLSVNKENLSSEAIDEKLKERTVDSDQDGVEDSIENCVVKVSAGQCVHTDPEKRDTDGDGYWDSIEPHLGN